jgi:hypothetical protein
MNSRGGSLGGRLLGRCIIAELAPDRAIKLPRWSYAGVTVEPRETVADDVIRQRPFVPLIPRVPG